MFQPQGHKNLPAFSHLCSTTRCGAFPNGPIVGNHSVIGKGEKVRRFARHSERLRMCAAWRRNLQLPVVTRDMSSRTKLLIDNYLLERTDCSYYLPPIPSNPVKI